MQGVDCALPLRFSPTGGHRIFHHDGELVVPAAAERVDNPASNARLRCGRAS
jgi:isopentenyl diphosphate isomerase/L-lactate dehydrogenase-like FMN-dependent dehydrogenase